MDTAHIYKSVVYSNNCDFRVRVWRFATLLQPAGGKQNNCVFKIKILPHDQIMMYTAFFLSLSKYWFETIHFWYSNLTTGRLLFQGHWSDIAGRRFVLIFCLIMSSVGYTLFGLAASVFMLFVARIPGGMLKRFPAGILYRGIYVNMQSISQKSFYCYGLGRIFMDIFIFC